MTVPDFQTIMRPVLVALEDGQAKPTSEIRVAVAQRFGLTQDELEEKIPSGRAKRFANRVGWALTYLYRTQLIERPKRSTYRITERGSNVLGQHPERVDMKVLGQFDEFTEFKTAKSTTPSSAEGTATLEPDAHTPEELIGAAYGELRAALAAELLDRVVEQTPDSFEQLVLDVLRGMGYGGSSEDATQVLGKSGDEGVDGVIREDELGLDLIYLQAKKWKKNQPVGRPEIQKFFGALHGKHATKGVFITTSTFSKEASEYAEGVTPRIILVDGPSLASLMITHNVGVGLAQRFEIKRVDADYFASLEGEETAASG